MHCAYSQVSSPRRICHSTDLDFTRRTEITDEGIMELMLDAPSQLYYRSAYVEIDISLTENLTNFRIVDIGRKRRRRSSPVKGINPYLL